MPNPAPDQCCRITRGWSPGMTHISKQSQVGASKVQPGLGLLNKREQSCLLAMFSGVSGCLCLWGSRTVCRCGLRGASMCSCCWRGIVSLSRALLVGKRALHGLSTPGKWTHTLSLKPSSRVERPSHWSRGWVCRVSSNHGAASHDLDFSPVELNLPTFWFPID